MKKVLLFLGAAVVVSVLFAFQSYAGGASVDVTLPDVTGDFDSVNRCRCKKNGCYGGNAISFRAACAKDTAPIDCSDYLGVCKD